jgi:hypothetical protein
MMSLDDGITIMSFDDDIITRPLLVPVPHGTHKGIPPGKCLRGDPTDPVWPLCCKGVAVQGWVGGALSLRPHA